MAKFKILDQVMAEKQRFEDKKREMAERAREKQPPTF